MYIFMSDSKRRGGGKVAVAYTHRRFCSYRENAGRPGASGRAGRDGICRAPETSAFEVFEVFARSSERGHPIDRSGHPPQNPDQGLFVSVPSIQVNPAALRRSSLISYQYAYMQV